MPINCKRCKTKKSIAKGLCNRCYYATKNGWLTYPEMIKKYNYIKGEYGILSTKKGEKYIVDTDDFVKCSKYIWSSNGNGYAKHNKIGFLHRFICPQYKIIDHINKNTFDNRKSNLREGRWINILNSDIRKKPCPIYKNKHGYWFGQTFIMKKRYYIKQSKNKDIIIKKMSKLLKKHNRLQFYNLQN